MCQSQTHIKINFSNKKWHSNYSKIISPIFGSHELFQRNDYFFVNTIYADTRIARRARTSCLDESNFRHAPRRTNAKTSRRELAGTRVRNSNAVEIRAIDAKWDARPFARCDHIASADPRRTIYNDISPNLTPRQHQTYWNSTQLRSPQSVCRRWRWRATGERAARWRHMIERQRHRETEATRLRLDVGAPAKRRSLLYRRTSCQIGPASAGRGWHQFLLYIFIYFFFTYLAATVARYRIHFYPRSKFFYCVFYRKFKRFSVK